ITRLPLGNTWATKAARTMLMDSWRWMEPAPTLELSEPILTRLEGSITGGITFSRPKKLVRLALSELVRLREVVFCILAVSATETFTVITSPTCMARGAWKKLCDPGCHRELLSWVMGWGRGISATIFCPAGFPTAESLGASPIFSSRSTAEQADRAAPASSRAESFRTFLRMADPYRD